MVQSVAKDLFDEARRACSTTFGSTRLSMKTETNDFDLNVLEYCCFGPIKSNSIKKKEEEEEAKKKKKTRKSFVEMK